MGVCGSTCEGLLADEVGRYAEFVGLAGVVDEVEQVIAESEVCLTLCLVQHEVVLEDCENIHHFGPVVGCEFAEVARSSGIGRPPKRSMRQVRHVLRRDEASLRQ